MPKLKYLEDLSVGGVTSYPLNTGVVAIADVLRSMRKLQVISFLGTAITDIDSCHEESVC